MAWSLVEDGRWTDRRATSSRPDDGLQWVDHGGRLKRDQHNGTSKKTNTLDTMVLILLLTADISLA